MGKTRCWRCRNPLYGKMLKRGYHDCKRCECTYRIDEKGSIDKLIYTGMSMYGR
ncbi:MAG: hypothetical protein MPK75_01725 [Alphaproteobacteria bacterium]|nr:hypothetical protein [Alphaproteobacteria bacterium]